MLVLLLRSGKQAIKNALEREHGIYEHATYYPAAEPIQVIAWHLHSNPNTNLRILLLLLLLLFFLHSLIEGKQAIMHALEREHGIYEHATYYPVAVAADDQHNTAFVGVAWEYKNVGPLKEGAQPSGK